MTKRNRLYLVFQISHINPVSQQRLRCIQHGAVEDVLYIYSNKMGRKKTPLDRGHSALIFTKTGQHMTKENT